MMVAPDIGWSNAIPDSAGDVDFSVNGEKFNFQGSGYHDHVSFLNCLSLRTLNNSQPQNWGSAFPRQHCTRTLGKRSSGRLLNRMVDRQRS